MTDMASQRVWRPPVLGPLVERDYLARLGRPDPLPPTAAALRDLHARHVERIPYETVWIHLNGAFSALLTALGYDVRWHVGGVQRRGGEAPGADANHLVLSVHGLPDEQAPDGVWYVDVGLGDALHEPLALRPGVAQQGGFTYLLRRSDVVTGGWRFEHDPRGGFEGMDFASPPAAPGAFEDRHRWLSTSPDSGFVRLLTVQRRGATGVDVLRGCLLSRVNGTGEGIAYRDVTSLRRIVSDS